jgi:ABC-type transporter Mla subunit MlaD
MATKTTSRSRAKKPANKNSKPVDRLDDAIAAAQDALKDLRGDLSRGRKTLVKDLDKTLKDARSNLRRVRGTLVEDLDDVGRKLTGKPKPKAAANAKPKAAAKAKPKAAAKAKPKAAAKPKPRAAAKAKPKKAK